MSSISLVTSISPGETKSNERSDAVKIGSITTDVGTFDLWGYVEATVKETAAGYAYIGPIYFRISSAHRFENCKVNASSVISVSNFDINSFDSTRSSGDTFVIAKSETNNINIWSANTVDARNVYTDSDPIVASATFGFSFTVTVYHQNTGTYSYPSFSVNPIIVKVTVNGGKQPKYYNIRYVNDDGSLIVGYRDIREGTLKYTESASTSAKTPPSSSTSHTYRLHYDSQGGSAVSPNPKVLSGTDKIYYRYDFDYWRCDDGNVYSANQKFNVTRNMVFTAVYKAVEINREPVSRPKVGSLPTVTRLGYIQNKDWLYSNGGIVDSSDELINNDTYIHINWLGKEKNYQVKYNKNTNDRTYHPESGQVLPTILEGGKTYNRNATLTEVNLLRTGWKFDGWYNDQINKQLGYDLVYSKKSGSWNFSFNDQTQKFEMNGIGDSINYNNIYTLTQKNLNAFDDIYYNKIASPTTNPSITLNALWSLNENAIRCYYYNKLTVSINNPRYLDLFYNIKGYTSAGSESSTTFEYGAPIGHEQLEDNSNYAFLGWIKSTDMTPEEISYWKNNSHGIYKHPDDLKNDIMWVRNGHTPSNILINNLNTIEDWGETSIYYGFWIGTGKYIKVDDRWKKVSEVFFKENGKWKSVKEMFVKVGNVWKKEVIYE